MITGYESFHLESGFQPLEHLHQPRSPVFILAPAPRSGTNYLANILILHPAFQIPTLIWEDHVLVYSQLLEQYVCETSKRWSSEIGNKEEYRNDLLRHLGGGILSFLCEHIEENKRLLCVTPKPRNIDNFFRLFPQAKLLVLIRDGRDVVDSAVRTWPNRVLAFERSAHTWAKGARLILQFVEGPGHELQGMSWKLVKYEDIVKSPEATLRDLLAFLDLDADTFDMTQVESLPLWGSSVYHGGRDQVHWDPVEKPKNFHPIGRWKSWGHWQRLVFNIIAGRELVRLSYVDSYHW